MVVEHENDKGEKAEKTVGTHVHTLFPSWPPLKPPALSAPAMPHSRRSYASRSAASAAPLSAPPPQR